MRRIDLETWPRRRQYDLFSTLTFPHFNLCANVDITAFYPAVKQRGVSFTIAVMYFIARTANAIPEFRTRIRGDEVVEHEVVHPSATVLTGDEQFTYYTVPYTADFPAFAARAVERIARAKENPSLEDDEDFDTLIFLTSIPWVSFTNIMHPQHLDPVDSVPRIAWGKFFEAGGALKMPVSVQGHHALMDGLHAGKFYMQMQEMLNAPEGFMGAG